MSQTDTRRKLGRPKTAMLELPVYDSMQACAAATGIPLDLQKKAKSAGCDAFRSNRVALGPLLQWIFSTDDGAEDGSGIWGRAQFDDWHAKREKIKHDREAKLVADKGETIFAVAQIQAAMFSQLDRLKSEMPPLLKGLNETEIYQRFSAKLDDLRTELAAKYDTLAKD
jgi:hypothetical protein